MSILATRVFYDTCKQQIGTPSTIYDLGEITCRTIQKFSEKDNPTVSKIQNLILNPARNLLDIYTFQDNLFKFWEAPVFSKGLQTIKNTCDVLPIFSAINLIESASLEYIPYIKRPINFIQSTYSLYDSVSAALPSVNLNRLTSSNTKKDTVKKLLDQLEIVDNVLQSKDPSKKDCLYEACRKIQELSSIAEELVDSKPQRSLAILNSMILNSEDIRNNLTPDEISKLQKILHQSLKEGCNSQVLQNISEEFREYLDAIDRASENKTLLEVLKVAISWILGASSMLNLLFLGFSIPGTTVFYLELCSFIVRLAISTYKNYLNNL